MQEIKAIETHYKGYRFRSRLEARWAVCLDVIGLEWDYEPEGFALSIGPYLPDFYIPAANVWIEVKGRKPDYDELEKARQLHAVTGATVVIVGQFSGHRAMLWDHWGLKDDFRLFSSATPQDSLEMFRRSELDDGHWGRHVSCPVCGCSNVHVGDCAYDKDNDETRINFWCESNCTWDMRLKFHKGDTWMFIDSPGLRIYDVLKFLASGNGTLAAGAAEAACGARFEHGENPLRGFAG